MISTKVLQPVFFSIVIPFFNREKYLGKAIRSVLNQSLGQWELILVNDGSTDNSLFIAQSFDDPRIKVVSHYPNQGNATARNVGWKAANYSWVAYLDSDDWYEQEYLERITKEIHQFPSTSFFWTGVRFVDEKSNFLKEECWKPVQALPSDTFFDQLRIGTNAGVCFSKQLLEETGGFEEKLRASVDREFFLRISQYYEGILVNFIGVNCLLGSHESVRKSYKNQAEAYDFLCEKYKAEIASTLKRKKWWYHKAMWLNLYCGKKGRAFAFLRKTNYHIKSGLLYLIFLVLPIRQAIHTHKKIST